MRGALFPILSYGLLSFGEVETAAAAATTAAVSEERLVLAIKHSPAALQALEKKAYELADPRSDTYGKWLTAAEVEAFVAPSPETVARVQAHVALECAGSKDTPSHIEMALSGQGDFLEVRGADEACIDRLIHRKSWNTRGDVPIEGAFRLRSSAASNLPQKGAPARRRTFSPVAGATLEAVGPPNAQKAAYGIPSDEDGALADGGQQLQLVWGPGTFGYLPSDLSAFYDAFDVAGASVDHLRPFGYVGEVGGDNFGEATLDVSYISGLAGAPETVVANTNDTESTEETTGFGPALLAFAHLLAGAGTAREPRLPLPSVVSMSLGNLSYDSCELLCTNLASDPANAYSFDDCTAYMATQRQVCMFPFDEPELPSRINAEFLKAAARGVTLLAATGGGSDGGADRFALLRLGVCR